LGKVAIDQLREGMVSDQTIFNDQGLILVASGVTFTNFIIRQLRNFDIETVSVKDEQELVQESSANTSAPSKPLAAIRNITDGIFDCQAIAIKKNITAIEEILASALDRPCVQDFMTACSSDEPLFRHSLRTAILSTNIGLIKRYSIDNLEKLAICTLLHDCGMEKKFNETDLDHPFLGFDKLRKNLDIDMLVALVCLQHHEHYDGSGYPFSFSRTQITEFSSLVAVVDYYDRLLIKDVEPRKAMFQTIEKKGKFFDPGMIDVFGSTIDWSRIYTLPPSIS